MKREDMMPCENECGRRTQKLRELPEKGEGWYCSACVQKAKDDAYEEEKRFRKVMSMSPERYAQYKRNQKQSGNSPSVAMIREAHKKGELG